MPDFSSMSLTELLNPQGFDCTCGMRHHTQLKAVFSEHGAVKRLPEALELAGIRRPFVFCDLHTREAAWEPARQALEAAGISTTLVVTLNRFRASLVSSVTVP